MKLFNTLLVVGLAVASLAVGGAGAYSGTVDCVGTKRTFTLTTTPTASCFATAALGGHNISGNDSGSNPDPLFALYLTAFGVPALLIDKNDDATSGTNPTALTVANGTKSGVWSFTALTAPLGKIYTDLIIAFKTGGNKDKISVWAAFLLEDGVSAGFWSTTGKNSLSHANLYGRLVDAPPPPPSPVPLPATAWMLFTGIAALAGIRRRKVV